MKVLVINQHIFDAIGGSEMQCHILALGLARLGHEVIYGVVGKKKKQDYLFSSYKIIPLYIEVRKLFEAQIKQIAPDIIYWRYNKIYLRRASNIFINLKIPYIFAVSSNTDIQKFSYKDRMKGDNFFKEIKRMLSYFKQMLNSYFNYIGILNANAITSLNSEYLKGLKKKKSFVVYNSVPSEIADFSWSREFIVWISNIKANKRPELFLGLAEKMSRSFPHIDFLMVGEIRQLEYIRLIEKKEKEIKNFYYLGLKSPAQVNGILSKSLFMVHTCKPEGFGNNFIQSWVQGKPTVSYEFDPDGLITKERLGLVSGGDDKQFYDQVKTLIVDSCMRETLGNCAYLFAKERFSSHLMVDKINKIMLDILN